MVPAYVSATGNINANVALPDGESLVGVRESPCEPIYMDNNATTPVDPRVLSAMLPWFSENFGNPNSTTYVQGVKAKQALEKARGEVANLLGADSPSEIVFTSGATEANAIAISGTIEHIAITSHTTGECSPVVPHIVTSKLEHNCVLGSCARLEQLGLAIVTYIGVATPDGVTYAHQVEAALRPHTVLVSIMLANNEIGVINDIHAIALLCRKRGILFHVDGSQGVGKIPFSLKDHPVDLLSVSAHKWYGPKGVGALFIRKTTAKSRLSALVRGGGQEGGMRGGTQNVPCIVGMGVAAAISAAEVVTEAERIRAMRDHAIERLDRELPVGCKMRINGSTAAGQRVPGNLNVSFIGCEREGMLSQVWGKVSFSASSACAADSGHISHVLGAIGVPPDWATMRLGFGRFNTSAEVDQVCDTIVAAAKANLRHPLHQAEACSEAGKHLKRPLPTPNGALGVYSCKVNALLPAYVRSDSNSAVCNSAGL